MNTRLLSFLKSYRFLLHFDFFMHTPKIFQRLLTDWIMTESTVIPASAIMQYMKENAPHGLGIVIINTIRYDSDDKGKTYTLHTFPISRCCSTEEEDPHEGMDSPLSSIVRAGRSDMASFALMLFEFLPTKQIIPPNHGPYQLLLFCCTRSVFLCLFHFLWR